MLYIFGQNPPPLRPLLVVGVQKSAEFPIAETNPRDPLQATRNMIDTILLDNIPSKEIFATYGYGIPDSILSHLHLNSPDDTTYPSGPIIHAGDVVMLVSERGTQIIRYGKE